MELNQITGRHCVSTYASLTEFAEYAESFADRFGRKLWSSYRAHWSFGSEDTRDDYRDAYTMAREGWDYHVDAALALTDQVVEAVRDDTVTDFRPVWDFQGSQVDIGAYLTGEPECMIDYPPTETTKVGRVVTICVSLSVSSAMSTEAVIARGVMITALAEILSQRGLNTEIWGDRTSTHGAYSATHRILIKGTNDVIDHSRILYALANPSMLRVLAFSADMGLPADWMGCGQGMGQVGTTRQDMEEGTLYLGSHAGSYDMAAELRGYLKQLGLLED